jgi:LPXTG-motif cell wall-anchored protein
MDEMKLLDGGGTAIGRIHNDVNLATVMATYNGQTIQIPRIQDATAQDLFAWDIAWTSEGVAATRTINLLCRCQCTAATCHWGGCEEYWFQYDDGTWATNGFCQCWTETQNMTLIFVYKTTDMSLFENYGVLGYQVNNLAQLYYIADGNVSVQVDYDDATVPIPNLFEKRLTHDFNGYTAHYRITVNEAKTVLTNGAPLTIHDVMTDTLAYMSGSLVITTENANGHKSTLQQGVDYTVTYDGTGHQTDDSGKKVHVLNIVILKPQPVMYILDYDTTLVMPEQITGGIRYSNSASISLWGGEVKDTGVEKVYADINIATKSFTVDMFKTCAVTGKPLPGATFGLYNAQGGLITTGITDINGKLAFQTNVIKGIILQEHTLYYLQEIQPPTAYRLDDTMHWFCFCDGTAETCSRCDALLTDVKSFRIPFEQVGIVDLANYPANVELPATGGIGTPIYMLCGLALIIGPLVYGFSLRRRHGIRSKT